MPNMDDRRAFLRAAAAAGVAWAGADLLQVQEALASAARQAASGGANGLEALTVAQAGTIDALTSRILPSVDGRPGAHEAGVVYFIDRALATFNAGQKPLYAGGIANLEARAVRKWKGAAGFAALTAEQQDGLIRAIEKTPFFAAARFDTMCGAFALPVWGGNRGHSGWHMLGLTHEPAFQPPFGYYDTDAERGR